MFRIALACLLLASLPATALGCVACSSGLIGTAFRFAPVWLAVLIFWLIAAAMLEALWTKPQPTQPALALILHGFRKSCESLLFWTIILCFLQIHLLAVLLIPFPLLRLIRQRPSADEVDAQGMMLFRRLRQVAIGTVLFLVFTALLSVAGIFPTPTSERRARALVAETRQVLHRVIESSAGTELSSLSSRPEDPFSYQLVKIPWLSALVMSEAFEEPDPGGPSSVRHAVGRSGQIAWSRGPDGRSDLIRPFVKRYLDGAPTTGTTHNALLRLTYDPTNGSYSPGDVWVFRAK